MARLVLLAVLFMGVGACGAFGLHRHFLAQRLIAPFADALPDDAALHAYAEGLAKPAYAAHCATCHGAALQGDATRGVPGFRHGAWLYDFGRVSDIERTILYGIRAGNARGRNVTDMPALGITHALSSADIADAAAYVISLSRPAGDAARIARGDAIYHGKGQCFDCHGAAGEGNIDWGVPAFTSGTWQYGGDEATVRTSIYDGRHGRCPAWIHVLDPATIRALAWWLHGQRHA